MEAFQIGAGGPLVEKPVAKHHKCAAAVVLTRNRWVVAKIVLEVKMKQGSVVCLHAAVS